MTANTLDRQRRKVDLWTRRPKMTEDEVEAEIDAELAEEAEREAEHAAKLAEFSDTLDAVWRCRACRTTATGRTDGYCDDCRAAAYVLRGQAALDELVGKSTRRELIEADLAARRKAGY